MTGNEMLFAEIYELRLVTGTRGLFLFASWMKSTAARRIQWRWNIPHQYNSFRLDLWIWNWNS
jgi:hypothetical protein